MDILLSNISRKHIDNFIASKSQSLGLIAPSGFGKYTIAKYISSKMLKTKKISNNPNILIIKPNEKEIITIEEVRKIVVFLKFKSTFKKEIARIVIIKDAELLAESAQNLLLKPLEELPKDVLVILCAKSTQSLLPTILSRIEIIKLVPPELEQANNHFSEEFSKEQIEKNWAIAQGRLGLFCAISNNSDHILIEQIALAKSFISKNKYQRSIAINDLTNSNLATFLDALLIISESGFYSSAKSNSSQLLFWHNLRKATLQALKEYQSKGNSKLILTKLVVNL